MKYCNSNYNMHNNMNHNNRLEEVLSQFYLQKAKLEFVSQEFDNDWLAVGITSIQGWRVRQEDSHLCDLNFDSSNETRIALFGVFDGHNGREVAEFATEMLPKHIKNNLRYSRDYVTVLKQSFQEFDSTLLYEDCNQELYYKYITYEAQKGYVGTRRLKSPVIAANTGSTAVVALLTTKGHIYVANIGDSRCVLCVKGKVYPLSMDHKPTDQNERRRIERAGYTVVNGRINHGLNLSRAFGDHLMKNNASLSATDQAVIALPDVTLSNQSLKADDFMVLACDGIWNCLSNKGLCSLVRKQIKKGTPLSKICEKVVTKCVSPERPINGQVGGDNMTCIIVKFKRHLPLY